MKPMLKSAFFSAVKSLLADDFKPTFYTVNSGTIGIISYIDKNGTKQVEQVYSCSHIARDTITPRFQGWFNAIMAEHHASVADKLSVGDKVMDGKTERTVTHISRRVLLDSNGLRKNQACPASGEIVLDGLIKVMAGEITLLADKDEGTPLPEVVYGESQKMTPTDAVRHMAYTLTGLIEQSKKPDFNEAEAYADVKTNYDRVVAECDDLAIVVWLKQNLCFGYVGDKCTFFDVNAPYLNRFIHVLGTGWLPSSEAGAAIGLSTVFEMDWWGADSIVITSQAGDCITGTATVTDMEGLYQIALDWTADSGEEARNSDLPVIIRVTGGRFTLPYNVTLTDCDPLEAIQEMDYVLGLSADIFNHLNGLGLIPGQTSQGSPNETEAETEEQPGKLQG